MRHHFGNIRVRDEPLNGIGHVEVNAVCLRLSLVQLRDAAPRKNRLGDSSGILRVNGEHGEEPEEPPTH